MARIQCGAEIIAQFPGDLWMKARNQFAQARDVDVEANKERIRELRESPEEDDSSGAAE